MSIIEFEKCKPSAEDPRKLEYAGQRTAQEVFEELKDRLNGQSQTNPPLVTSFGFEKKPDTPPAAPDGR